jgi:GT2 family glycosyltransferase
MTSITFIIPTRNRPDVLARTLTALGALHPARLRHTCAEVIVVDNASTISPRVPPVLPNGLPARVIALRENHAAASRNVAAAEATGEWLIMLDDDSYPLDTGFLDALVEAPPQVAAIGAEILINDELHESGGLPEVFIGCGVAIRREVFRALGGYDSAFHYYVEEYDLAARLIAAGYRIEHDFRFRVRHEKVPGGRDMNLILQRLVRNNGWVALRYAPPHLRRMEVVHSVFRYGRIAWKERAGAGWRRGLIELARSWRAQPRRALPMPLYDRFTGLAAVRDRLCGLVEGRRVAIVAPGKNVELIRNVVVEQGGVLTREDRAEMRVVGTMSPGPMLDAWRQYDGAAQMPWLPKPAAAPAGACAA